MNCRDFHELLDSYLSDELLTETNHDILRHLDGCAECRSEIEARRMVRARLRSAVRGASEYEMSNHFEERLRSTLAGRRSTEGIRSRGFFGLRAGWVAAAACVLVIAGLGTFYTMRNPAAAEIASRPAVLRANTLPPSDIVNVAATDHENCAVKYFTDRPETTVAKVRPEYRELARVVSSEIKGVLKDCDLIDSHSCGYGGVRFSHVVMNNDGQMLSVLVTRDHPDAEKAVGEVLNFESEKYSISRVNVRDRAVFVVSKLDSESNARAAGKLAAPLNVHYGRSGDMESIRSALLLAR